MYKVVAELPNRSLKSMGKGAKTVLVDLFCRSCLLIVFGSPPWAKKKKKKNLDLTNNAPKFGISHKFLFHKHPASIMEFLGGETAASTNFSFPVVIYKPTSFFLPSSKASKRNPRWVKQLSHSNFQVKDFWVGPSLRFERNGTLRVLEFLPMLGSWIWIVNERLTFFGMFKVVPLVLPVCSLGEITLIPLTHLN